MAKLTNSLVTNKLQQAKVGKGLKATATRFNVSVWQRKLFDKDFNATGKCTVMLDLQYGKQRKSFSTNIKCQFGELDSTNFRINGEEHQTLLLQDMKNTAEKAFIDLRMTERNIDLELIKSLVLGSGMVGIPSFQQCLAMFYKTFEDSEAIGELAKGTLKKIKVWHNHISEFGLSYYGKDSVLENVTPYDIKAFVMWLKKEKKLSHNVTQMISAHFKRTMNYALENEWIKRNPFMNYRRKFETKRGEALTEKEVIKIENLTLITSLDRVRDVFLFQTYTGLSYSDCKGLRPNHFLKTETGEVYIFKQREKSGKDQTVYLLDRALRILEKYKDDAYCTQYGLVLPVISNHKLNLQLKAIGALAGIDKVLTTHVSRRTYATILYNAGLSELATKATMGHSDISMTLKHYATAERETILFDLKEAFQRTKIGQ